MEEEIDLRVYISVLIRRWWLIAGLTVIAGVAAFVVSSLMPATYQAAAVVVITRPLYQFQFSREIQNLEGVLGGQLLSGKAALDLALGDTVLEQLATKMANDVPPQERSLSRLRDTLKATAGGDASVVRLTASNHDP